MRILGLPLPRAAFDFRARVHGMGGTYHFEVHARIFGIGTLIRYAGVLHVGS
jgi:hypothetical protein